MQIYLQKLFFVSLLLLVLPQTISAARIYGGYYTKERIANLRSNCQKYEWARQRLKAAVKRAAPWVEKRDETLWKMIPGQDLPRTIDVGYDKFSIPKFIGCLVCGKKIFEYGNYPYTIDFEHKPWKITCPSCGAVFPTNDFGQFYESAIDDHGLFNPALGDSSLLYNTDHPDPKDPLHKYGVDNGFGYIHKGRTYKFIGYYTWKYWRYILNGIAALSDAFLYTGDQRYAHKAAILLDRIADVYPAMDWHPYARLGWYHSDGGSGRGKIEGSIWENGTVRRLADAYDKILSGTVDDPALYAFLEHQSKRYKLPSPKGTRALFVANVDNRILKTAFKAVLARRIWGNQGMQQLTVARCAIALNTNPLTSRWLDWLFNPRGGAITELMFNHFDRDGTSDEGAPGYAFIWGRLIAQLAGLLNGYSGYTHHNIIRDFPQFKAVFTAAYRMAVLGQAIPNLGDAGSTGLVSRAAIDPVFMALGYRYTRDTSLAIAAYRANGNSAKGLGYNIYSEQPELIHKEILRIGETAGPRPPGGYLMSGFGLAILEAGKGASGTALVSNYGRTTHHAHRDLLNFDLFAFGHWLAPDHGYPEFATNIPSRTEWTGSTISHNTVFVNQQPQRRIWGGHSRLFVQLNHLGVFQLEGRKAYKGIKTYRRTMFLVGDADSADRDNNTYAIDIFRVEGGADHVYSFHGPPGTVTYDGLRLLKQKHGTYAGENIPKGTKAKGFPIGYSFLYNVQKTVHPPAQFMVDWKTAPGYRGLTDKDNIHLRMYAMTPSDDVALADGDPPQNKPGNPETLKYLLIHRKDTNLNSTFVSLLEPYRNKPFIKSVHRLEEENSNCIILKVDKVNGEVDYILYNPLPNNKISLSNGILMQGNIGYIQLKDDRVVKGILINGSLLRYGKMKLTSSGKYTGKVVKFDKKNDGGGWLLVDARLPTDGSLIGRQIIIEAAGKRDASYKIRDVQSAGNLTKIFCGNSSFISGIKSDVQGKDNLNSTARAYAQYLYDFQNGASFKIDSYAIWEREK